MCLALAAFSARTLHAQTSCTASTSAAVQCFVSNAVTTNLAAPRHGLTLAQFQAYGVAVSQILQTHHSYLVLVTTASAVADAMPPINANGASAGLTGYAVSQPQGGHTLITPVFNIPCSGITFRGGGSRGNTGLQFAQGPTTSIGVVPGANPTAGPIFGFGPAYNTSASPNNGMTLENLTIHGYNQAVANISTSNTTLRNVNMVVQTTGFTGSGTTYTDNVAMVTNGFWLKWIEGTFNNGNVLLVLDNSGSGPYDADFENLIAVSSQFVASVRQNNIAIAGAWSFRNITREGAITGQDFVTFRNDTGNSCITALPAGVQDITLDHLIDADASATSLAVISFNANMSGCAVRNIYVRNSEAGNAGTGTQIRMNGGTLSNSTVIGTSLGGSDLIVDGNGNPVGGAQLISNGNGNDTIVFTGGDDPRNSTNPPRRLSTDLFTQGVAPAPGWGLTASGNQQRGLAGDPVAGILFADGVNAGYTANLLQAARESMDVSFATVAPPSNFAGTATTGGTLTAGTYFYSIRANTTGNCSTIAVTSAPAIITAGIVVGGSNNAVSLTWTPIAGALPTTEYCLQRQTTNSNFFGTQNGWSIAAPASSSRHRRESHAMGRVGELHESSSFCAPFHANFARHQHHQSTIQSRCERFC
jgi:hypothetical protein